MSEALVPFRCPVCGSAHSAVVDSRPHGTRIRRRRLCDNGHRFTTQEFITSEMDDIAIALERMEVVLQEARECAAIIRRLRSGVTKAKDAA